MAEAVGGQSHDVTVPKRSAIDAHLLGDVFPDLVAPRPALVEMGIPSSSITHRCRPGGPWRRLIPGVVQLHNGDPTRRQLAIAALIHSGGGVLTGVDCAARHGLRRTPKDNRVHVLIPHRRKVASSGFVVVERTIRMPEATTREGLPLAPLARAIIDAAHRMRGVDDIRAMVAEAVQRGMCHPKDLRSELDAGTRIGSALPRRVLAEIDAGVRSAAEAWARSTVRRSRLPEPEWNVAIRNPAGELLGVADAYWRAVGLAWEIDSKEYHLSPGGYARTLDKHNDMTSAGIIVVHTLPSRLRSDPIGVVRDLIQAYRLAESCPTPLVTASLWRPAA